MLSGQKTVGKSGNLEILEKRICSEFFFIKSRIRFLNFCSRIKIFDFFDERETEMVRNFFPGILLTGRAGRHILIISCDLKSVRSRFWARN